MKYVVEICASKRDVRSESLFDYRTVKEGTEKGNGNVEVREWWK